MKYEENEAKKIVQESSAYFESCLLYLVLKNGKFWEDRCSYNVNIKKDKFSSYSDFSKPIDNSIYNIVSAFYSALKSNGLLSENSSIDSGIINGLLDAKLKSDYISIDDVKNIEYRLDSITKQHKDSDIKSLEDLVNSCFEYWLDSSRAKQVAADALKHGDNISDILSKIKAASDAITRTSTINKRGIMDVVESYNNVEDIDSWERIPIANLHQLSHAMNGGIKKKECMLIIAPPGGGKTTCSCQVAVGLALSGKKVVYITTEQEDSEILPKMISCGANIPYAKIMDGLMKRDQVGNLIPVLCPDESEVVKEFLLKIDGRIFFENWCSSGAKIKSHLDSVIEQYSKTGGVDVILIDWLGGGVDMDAINGDKKRFFLDECCRIIKEAAQKFNVAIITCAQASSAKAEQIKYITSAEISEHTMMHTYFTWALGISSIGVNKKGNFNGEIDNTNTKQYFNLFKTRKSKGIAYPVTTDFGYSRFIETQGDINPEESIIANRQNCISLQKAAEEFSGVKI